LKNYFYFLFVFLLLIGCDNTDRNSYLPGYSGQVGEVVVVCSKQSWQGALGDEIRNVISRPQYGLPQEEAKFSAIQVNNRVLNTHRNVFNVIINDSIKTEGLKFKKNKYAKGQMFVEVKAKTYEDALNITKENNNGIISLFERAELNRIIARNKKLGPKIENKKIEEQFGVKLFLQKDFEVRVIKPGFVWARLERERPVGGYQHQIDQNIIISETDYTDRTQFLDSILNLQRDAIFNIIPGPTENSFVTTDYEFVPPMYQEIEIEKTYTKQVYGLWRMENNFMGGPFVGISFVHPKKDKIINIYGFVFAPQFNKREYLREIDAILRSVSFSE
jgi:hypothetical protein